MVQTLAGAGQALDSSLPTVYRIFNTLRDEAGVARSCATGLTLGAHEGAVKYINNYGRAVAFNLQDGADMAQQQTLADTATGYQPTEVGVQITLGGRTMRRVADPDLMGRTAKILHNAYDLKEDGDGCTQLASFTGTTLGSAGVVVSPGIISAGAARVMVGNSRTNPEPPNGDIFALIHPLSAHALHGRLIPYSNVPTGTNVYGADNGAHAGVTVTNGGMTASGDELRRKGYKAIGMVGGAIVKTDANIAVDASNDATGAVFAKEGFIHVTELEPSLKWDTSDVSMRGAAEGNLFGSFVWGQYRAAQWGNPVTVDASLPTT
jgi:hypothetical protein